VDVSCRNTKAASPVPSQPNKFWHGRALALGPAKKGRMSELKPKLVLLHGGMITAENIAKMFKALTGRDPEVSPEWLGRTNKELEEAYAKLNDGPKSGTPGMLDDGEGKH
jgi:hypothetical protein